MEFRPLTVVVGKNNAGKSTIVESLRLVATVVSRYRNLTYRRSPAWTELPKRLYGVSPSLGGLAINFDSIFFQYREPPARVVATFENSSRVSIYLHSEERVFAVIEDSDGTNIRSRSEANTAELPTVAIMPQIGPVAREETVLTEDYVRRSMGSSLASSHFRNQLYYLSEQFIPFQALVEDTWHGVQVKELIDTPTSQGRSLFLSVRNEDFVAEVGAMGHGLQMWLQTMWFLVRSKNVDTVILDEPDVYMHPDLQRRIVRFLNKRFSQVLLTTHSIEIMSEVEPGHILLIDRKARASRFIESLTAVQRLVTDIGSAQNIHLTKLYDARRFLIVEGKDLKLLKAFQNALGHDSETPIDSIPNMSIGGWGGWSHAVGSSLALKNAFGQSIKVYCIFDSDFHTEQSVERRYREAEERDVALHIWRRKEIENYLCVPAAIQRLIAKRVAKRTAPPSEGEVTKRIEELAEELKDVTFDSLSTEILAENRRLGSSGANKVARSILKARTETISLANVVSGKVLLSRISAWSQDEFGVPVSPSALAREMKPSEIHYEVSMVLKAIEQRLAFER